MDREQRRELMAAGRGAFNRGEFFEAHEFWEEVWDVADDPDRTWIQGLIQVATGLHKLAHGRPDVCRTLLHKALAKLHDVPGALDGLAAGRLRDQAAELLAALERREKRDPRAIQLGEIPEP
jgi:predicted metal-dependent hydrolase